MGCRKTRWMMPKRKRSATGLQPTNPRRSCVKSVRPVIGTGVGVSNRLDPGIDCRARPGNSPLLLHFPRRPRFLRLVSSSLHFLAPFPPSRSHMLIVISCFISHLPPSAERIFRISRVFLESFVFRCHLYRVYIQIHFLGKFVDVRPSWKVINYLAFFLVDRPFPS